MFDDKQIYIIEIGKTRISTYYTTGTKQEIKPQTTIPLNIKKQQKKEHLHYV